MKGFLNVLIFLIIMFMGSIADSSWDVLLPVFVICMIIIAVLLVIEGRL